MCVVSNGGVSAKKTDQQKRVGSLGLGLRRGVICVWNVQGFEKIHDANGCVFSNVVTKLAVRSVCSAEVVISYGCAGKWREVATQ